MTNEDKKLYLEAIEEALLMKTTPENFAEMAEPLLRLNELIQSYAWHNYYDIPTAPVASEAEKVKTIPSAPPDEETPKRTREDAKAKLILLRNQKGVDIAAVMQSFGHTRFSEFAESELAPLIKRAEEAVK